MIEKEFAHHMIDTLFAIREKIQDKVIPQDARQHLKKARKEGLLGIQAVLTHLIQEMDKCSEEDKEKNEPQVKKINVED